MLNRLRGELARSGLLEGKTPWLQLAVGADHLPHVAVLNPSKRYRAIENRFVAHLQKVEGLPRGAHVLFSESRKGREYGILVTSNPPLNLGRLLTKLDLLVLANEAAVDAKRPGLFESSPGYAYYKIGSR